MLSTSRTASSRIASPRTTPRLMLPGGILRRLIDAGIMVLAWKGKGVGDLNDVYTSGRGRDTLVDLYP